MRSPQRVSPRLFLKALFVAPFLLTFGAQEFPAGLSTPILAEIKADATQGFKNANPDNVRVEWVSSTNISDRVMRVKVLHSEERPYYSQIHQSTTVPIKKDDLLFLQFYARCEDPGELNEGHCEVVFEKAVPEWDKVLMFNFNLSPQWRLYQIPFTCTENFDSGGATLNFRLSFARQTLEFAQIRLFVMDKAVDLHMLPKQMHPEYAGAEADAPWRKAAEERIEQNRKTNVRIRLEDKDGKPISRAKVEIHQKRHFFDFGSAVQATRLARIDGNQEYAEKFKSMFNAAVIENALKWRSITDHWEEEGVGQKAVDWLRQNGFDVRGHCLLWPGWGNVPGWLRNHEKNAQALRAEIRKHILAETTEYAGKLRDWDVVNEPYDNHDIMDALGEDKKTDFGTGIVADAFRWAHEGDPNAKLFLNDSGMLEEGGANLPHQKHFEDTVKGIQRSGAPIHGIGIQCHFFSTPTSPERLLQLLDRYAQLNVEIRATEFDLDFDDEDLQAQYTRDFLTVFFSHPKVTGIFTWGFWEGAMWVPRGAMFRTDFSLKPNGRVWKELIYGRWWTNAEGSTNAEGMMSERVFYGTHSVVVTQGGQTKTFSFEVTPETKNKEFTFKL